MKQVNIKKLILPNLPYFLIGLYASKLGEAWRMAEGAELSDKFMNLMDGFAAAFASPFPSFYPPDFLVGVLCGAALRLAVYVKGKMRRNTGKMWSTGLLDWEPMKILPLTLIRYFRKILS